jgi:Na+-transporting methylmalonyl-CoA/oxaloacetate decarboxylase gamma subunit
VRPSAASGQATVELALVLPVLVVLTLVVVQVGQVVRQHVVVIHTAREVARAAAVAPDAPTTAEVADRHGLEAERLAVEVAPPDDGGYVLARVRLLAATDVVLVGPLLPDVPLSAEAQMRAEWVR